MIIASNMARYSLRIGSSSGCSFAHRFSRRLIASCISVWNSFAKSYDGPQICLCQGCLNFSRCLNCEGVRVESVSASPTPVRAQEKLALTMRPRCSSSATGSSRSTSAGVRINGSFSSRISLTCCDQDGQR